MTFFHKRIFPVFWFGLLAFTLIVPAFSQNRPPAGFFLAPVFMMAVGYLIMRFLIFDLVDEVYDCGDHLLVKNGSSETRIALADIANISYTTFTNPQRVTLSVRGRVPGELSEITFSPQKVWLPFVRHEAIKALIKRVDEARPRR